MSLDAVTKLGSYEILSSIGAGGMGTVWRARDTKLERDVAIKTLPDEFARDPERLARFEREAKVLASLNHPHIAAIHGFEDHRGTRFLVLELVEGETLAERLLPMQGEAKPFVFLNTPSDERSSQFSPDGRWVAYQSNESGRFEIYVRPFPGPGGQWLISAAGGIQARWSRDGKELYYVAPDGKG